MIKIENANVHGWEATIRGMRNPMNSGKSRIVENAKTLIVKIVTLWEKPVLNMIMILLSV